MTTTKLPIILLVWIAAVCLTIPAHAADRETVMFSFVRATGTQPQGQVTLDSAGNVYGAAFLGGFEQGGAIFELSPNGSGGWTNTDIVQCVNTLCYEPLGSMVWDSAGNLYGAGFLFGSVFELSNVAGVWSVTASYDFGTTGAPSNVVIDASGNLYGISGFGGSANKGWVFEATPAAGGTFTVIDLYDFTGPDGAESGCCVYSGVALDQFGNIYGTTPSGGSSANCSGGCGVVFKLTKSSGVWTETVLHSFNGTDGSLPQAAPFATSNGTVFGTTTTGGSAGFGDLYELTPVSGGSRYHVIHSFTGGNDGAGPNSPLVQDAAGNLYGTTPGGGSGGNGTVFEFSHASGSWHETILQAFDGADGSSPTGVTLDSRGNLYGVTASGGPNGNGVAYRLSPASGEGDQ
jgi:uncharacterized repeat protein (TIGR03803 family)